MLPFCPPIDVRTVIHVTGTLHPTVRNEKYLVRMKAIGWIIFWNIFPQVVSSHDSGA